MKVATTNLSPTLNDADPRYGTIDRGEMSTDALAALLMEFGRLDQNLNWEHDPIVIVHTPRASHAIRTDRGRFHLYNAKDTTQPAIDLPLEKLMAVLEERSALPSEPAIDEPIARESPRRHRIQKVAAAALLTLGLGLNAWGIYQFVRAGRSGAERTAPLPDANTAAMIAGKLAGTYATGTAPGDRLIMLQPEGIAKFQLFYQGPGGTVKTTDPTSDRYEFRLRPDGTVAIVTDKSGSITVTTAGSLVFWGDTYRRSAALAKEPERP